MSWRASLEWTKSGAAGYRIKAGLVSGTYTATQNQGDVSSGYIDLPSGGWWYVSVASLDSGGTETALSQEVYLQAFDYDPHTITPLAGVLGLLGYVPTRYMGSPLGGVIRLGVR